MDELHAEKNAFDEPRSAKKCKGTGKSSSNNNSVCDEDEDPLDEPRSAKKSKGTGKSSLNKNSVCDEDEDDAEVETIDISSVSVKNLLANIATDLKASIELLHAPCNWID